MANQWFRLYAEIVNDPKIQMMSEGAQDVLCIALKLAEEENSCYPNWRQVEILSGLTREDFLKSFEELCEKGIVSNSFPSTLITLMQRWPLVPMFGPVLHVRPAASVWEKIRTAIFKRDNYTCQYCGARGVRLECDHIHPVSLGGEHTDENLATACFKCNRSKHKKTLKEWRSKDGQN